MKAKRGQIKMPSRYAEMSEEEMESDGGSSRFVQVVSSIAPARRLGLVNSATETAGGMSVLSARFLTSVADGNYFRFGGSASDLGNIGFRVR